MFNLTIVKYYPLPQFDFKISFKKYIYITPRFKLKSCLYMDKNIYNCTFKPDLRIIVYLIMLYIMNSNQNKKINIL